MLLRPAEVESMTAYLVLAVGSNAGREAPLQDGYYMIGRHKECQIRPKSRSVSRRHCLLYSQNGEVFVRDLDSASGTKVNHRRLERSQWIRLRDGDELRCGKILFQVEIRPAGGSDANVSDDPASPKRQSMVTSEPWDSFDVAGMLASADEVDREARYKQIRSFQADKLDSETGADTCEFGESNDTVDTVVDIEDFADAFGEAAPVAVTAPATSAKMNSAPASNSIAAAATRKVASSNNEAAAKSTAPSTAPRASAKPKKKGRSQRSRDWAVRGFGDAHRTKIMAAALLALTVLGFFGYQVYQFASGPSVRVIQEID